MATPDITVLGAGILGLSAAWACQKAGARVRVIDPAGVGRGASGGPVGALAPHTPDQWNAKKAYQFASLLMAQSFWSEIEAVSGIPTGYRRSGRIQPLADARQIELAEGRVPAAERNWQSDAAWRVVAREELPEWCPPSPTGRFIHDTLSAQITPRMATESLAAAFVSKGGEVLRDGDAPGRVLHATGWTGLIELGEALGRPVGGGEKGQAIRLRHAAPSDAPQLFVGGLHLVTQPDGSVAVGSTSERDVADTEPTEDAARTLYERAIEALPLLKGAPIVERWAGMRPRAVSRAPIVDDWPGRPGHFILNGGFKIGFGMAPKLAEDAARIMAGDGSVPDLFRLSANT